MKIIDYFDKAKGQTLVSFEVLPPLKGGSMADIFQTLDPLMEFKPPFIDVTYHREEYVYNKRPSGYYEKTAIRKRPGTVGICASIMHRYGIDAIPHLICGGFSIEETENALIDLNFLGINNVLALRGDARQFEDKFIPEPDGHKFAVDLVKQVNDMNHGIYLDSNIEKGTPTDFCIGVAGYPEKHIEAPSMNYDLQMLKKKVEAGADYIVTQMFFDNQKFFDFVKQAREIGIDVPIIPGIKPIATKGHLQMLPQVFKIDLPENLISEVLKCKTNSDVREVGIEWAINQCKELLDFGIPVLHFYSMGKSDNILKIGREVF